MKAADHFYGVVQPKKNMNYKLHSRKYNTWRCLTFKSLIILQKPNFICNLNTKMGYTILLIFGIISIDIYSLIHDYFEIIAIYFNVGVELFDNE